MLKFIATFALPVVFLFQLSTQGVFAHNHSDQQDGSDQMEMSHAETNHAETNNNEINDQYVERAILTTSIDNREPVDDLGGHYQHSGAEFDRVAFFTHMKNHDGRGISHRWYFRGELEAEIELAVGSNSWRTYSSKQIGHMQEGDWTVRVVNDSGEQLVEYHFEVQR